MSTATAVAQRPPASTAATSPGYQGSSPPATQPTERPASAEMERQAAPASEPATIKEVDSNPDVAVEGDANAAANKACEDEDATPPKEVRKERIAYREHPLLLLLFVAKALLGGCCAEVGSRSVRPRWIAKISRDADGCKWLGRPASIDRGGYSSLRHRISRRIAVPPVLAFLSPFEIGRRVRS